jgi:hypothetical protein
MGIKDAAVPMLLFCVAVMGIAQSAITVNAYLTTNKKKDSSFNFSLFILVASVCLLFGSGYFAYKAFSGPAAEVAGSESGPSPEELAAAAAATKLGGIEMPTTAEVADAIPNVKAFTNVPSLRAAEAQFKVAVEKTKTALTTLEESINKRVANKVGALQQAAEVIATAEAKGA